MFAEPSTINGVGNSVVVSLIVRTLTTSMTVVRRIAIGYRAVQNAIGLATIVTDYLTTVTIFLWRSVEQTTHVRHRDHIGFKTAVANQESKRRTSAEHELTRIMTVRIKTVTISSAIFSEQTLDNNDRTDYNYVVQVVVFGGCTGTIYVVNVFSTQSNLKLWH